MSLSSWWNNTALPFLARISPLNNPAAVQVVIYAVVIVFFLAFLFRCTQAHAAEPNYVQSQPTAVLDISTGSTVVRGPTGVLAMNVVFPNVVANYASVSLGFDLIGKSSWGCPDATLCNNNQAVVHAQVVAPLPWKLELGIGVAHIQHADEFNSGSIDFSLSLQRNFIWKNTFIRYQHFSSAGTSSPNEGRDMVLVGYRFN